MRNSRLCARAYPWQATKLKVGPNDLSYKEADGRCLGRLRKECFVSRRRGLRFSKDTQPSSCLFATLVPPGQP
jgi:hypothetical protein